MTYRHKRDPQGLVLGGFSVSGFGSSVRPVTPFAGHTELTLDDKGRLSIPSKFRAVVTPVPTTGPAPASIAFYVLPWGESLVIISEQRFRELAAESSIDVRPTLAPITITKQRLFGISERVEPDGAGRVSLPKELVARLKLVGEVMMISGGDHLEVMPLALGRKLIDEMYGQLP